MTQDSLTQQLLEFSGAKKHETVPTAAKLVWTNNVPIRLPGWETDSDEALMRSLSPERIVIHKDEFLLPTKYHPLSVPDSQSPDEFRVVSLPSYGRGSIIELSQPVEVDGVQFPVVTAKGQGSAQKEVEEKGEVFGTPVDLNPDKYTAGFTGEYSFIADTEHTEAWKKAGLRVREPMRFYRYNRIFMTNGSEDIAKVADKFPRANDSGVAIWATRNPFTFQDAIKILTPRNKENVDVNYLKDQFYKLLQIQSVFLKYDSDTKANEIAAVLEKGNGAGEEEWFNWLSSMYGQQMMRKTAHGLIHGEQHRQNTSLGVEAKDLDDVAGLPDEMQPSSPEDPNFVEKNYGTWENLVDQSPDMAKEAIRENILVLAQIVDLKIVSNTLQGISWKKGVDGLVANFLTAMKEESPEIYNDVANRMQTVLMRSRSFIEGGGDSLYGFSRLCFMDNYSADEPLLPNSPTVATAATDIIFNNVRQTVDPHLLSSKERRSFDIDYYYYVYGIQTDEIVGLATAYNDLISKPNFIKSVMSLYQEVTKSTPVSRHLTDYNQVYYDFVDLVAKFNPTLPDIYDGIPDCFMHLLGIKLGITDFFADVMSTSPEKPVDFKPFEDRLQSQTQIDVEKLERMVDEYYAS